MPRPSTSRQVERFKSLEEREKTETSRHLHARLASYISLSARLEAQLRIVYNDLDRVKSLLLESGEIVTSADSIRDFVLSKQRKATEPEQEETPEQIQDRGPRAIVKKGPFN